MFDSNDYRLIESALNHYSQRLRYMVTDPEMIRIISKIVQTDLDKEAKNTDEIKDRVKKRDIYSDPDAEISIFSEEEVKKIVTNAFKSYLYDLTESKNLIIKKLGGSSPKLEFTNKEISYCTNFLAEFK